MGKEWERLRGTARAFGCAAARIGPQMMRGSRPSLASLRAPETGGACEGTGQSGQACRDGRRERWVRNRRWTRLFETRLTV